MTCIYFTLMFPRILRHLKALASMGVESKWHFHPEMQKPFKGDIPFKLILQDLPLLPFCWPREWPSAGRRKGRFPNLMKLAHFQTGSLSRGGLWFMVSLTSLTMNQDESPFSWFMPIRTLDYCIILHDLGCLDTSVNYV